MENEIAKVNKLHIPPYAKVKVNWDDRPENYSREAKSRIRSHFSKLYNIEKSNIDVVYRPIKVSDNGEVIEITGADIDNIMDVNYQRSLMKEWLDKSDSPSPQPDSTEYVNSYEINSIGNE